MTKYNIGCGVNRKDYPEYEGVDKIDFGQKWVGDIRGWDAMAEAETCDGIMAYHFLEHLTNKEALKFIHNCWVVLKPGATLKMMVPSIANPGAWALTHKSYYSEDTFRMFTTPVFVSEAKTDPWTIKELVTTSRNVIYVEFQK